MRPRHAFGVIAVAAIAAATATTGVLATQEKDPFVGSWHAVDVDGSHQFFFIEESAGGVHSVVYYDNETNACAAQLWAGIGVGSDELLTIEFGTRRCLAPEEGSRDGLPPWEFVYHQEDDTVTSTLLGENSAERVNTKDVAAAQKDIAQGHFDD